MKIYAIGDLHLPGGGDKPMDIFGSHWDGHFAKVCQDWQDRVKPEDLVLIPGDISWAMQLYEAKQDLMAIGELPGHKAVIRGNHDYWWNAISQVRAILPSGMQALQNDCLCYEQVVICGSRGWTVPDANGYLEEQDDKIYRRELGRMEMSLQRGQRAADGRALIVMMHYPPFNDRWEPSGFTALFEAYGVSQVVYGHLHGAAIKRAFCGWRTGIHYQLTSCDALNFTLWDLGSAAPA